MAGIGKYARWVRAGAVFVAATLVLDAASFWLYRPWMWQRTGEDMQRNYASAYRSDDILHHDLRPNLDRFVADNENVVRLITDRYGTRTGSCAGKPLAAPDAASTVEPIFLIGDSFTQGFGSSFEASWAGLFICAMRARGRTAINLGVSTYSPSIYHRKFSSYIERTGIVPREIVLFVDISDIDDEAVLYAEFEGGVVNADWLANPARVEKRRRRKAIKLWLRDAFALAYLYLQVAEALGRRDPRSNVDLEKSRWTVDDKLFREWGERGLARAAVGVDKLLEKCRALGCTMTLAVYPWPDQILNGDRDSIQVRFWRDWSARNEVRFLNLFPLFFNEPAQAAIERYHLPGDVHWNAAGNRMVFDALMKYRASLPAGGG